MSEKVIVTVKEGKIRGFKAKTHFSGTEYYAFLGVPYGQSTAGKARFKDPVEVKPWKNTLDATVEKGGCIQFSLRKNEIVGSEDCLYNNIYTPELPSKGKPLKAVMVNIHSGGLIHGSPDPSYYGAPDFIMHRDVVYVCIGYRLHIAGRMDLNMKCCSGNQSQKDIILSLRWIKKNIHTFGGDPENVTLMGSSSGSFLVHFLLLSPLAKGLYHKAILMGSYCLCPTRITASDNRLVAYELAKTVGYDEKPGEDKKLLNFYRNLDLGMFCLTRPERFNSKKGVQVYPAIPLNPSVYPGKDSPLPLAFKKLIPFTNRVPILIGFCEKEASVGMAFLQIDKLRISDVFYKIIAQNDDGWGAGLSESELRTIQKEVENFYLQGKSIDTATLSTLCDILTDASLSDVYDTLINVISADLPSSVFVYNFLYEGKLCTMKSKLEKYLGNEVKGAYHGDDYSYWCYNEAQAGKTMSRIQPKDREIIDTFTNLLTTFAKTSDPNHEGMKIQWKPTTPENPTHLVIDETLEVRDEVLNGKRLEFWHNLKIKFKKGFDAFD